MEINFPKIEKKIIKFWREYKIFERSIADQKKAPDFVFYEGPPTANAKAGLHHVLARVFKDIICRYRTMRGFRVLRKAGWDTHGLPVELEVEKKLGITGKKGIEKYGIARFNRVCQKSVWFYKSDWEKLTERIGFWLDMKHPYITYTSDYIETVWYILKKIWERGLLYQDYKVVPYCPRCGTPLSSHEVALGYKRIKENSVYLRFRVKSQDPAWQNTSILSWTTTPWTLPGNVALAVNPNAKYICIPDLDRPGSRLVLGLENFKRLLTQGALGKNYQEKFQGANLPSEKDIDIFTGAEMVGLEYEPLFNFAESGTTIYRIIPADFVSAEEGTGVVHIAPAFGEEDMEAIKMQNAKCKTQNLPEFPVLLTVDSDGKFKTPGYAWDGQFVKDSDPLIVEDLKQKNSLFKEELYEHDYPFCWRCATPLLYYARKAWFIKTQKIKSDLIKNNREINWMPSHLKEGRFGEWLRDLKDWALSRERYWGTPLPVWRCQTCGKIEVIGSKKDLASQKFTTNQFFIVRHGESLKNQKKIVSCWPEKFYCPLSQKGRVQIVSLASKLKGKIDVIYASDLLRTKETAEIIGNTLGLTPEYDQALREIDYSKFNGRPLEEVGRFFNPERKLTRTEYYLKRFKDRTPGVENYTRAQKRMYDFLKRINQRHTGKRILLVGHEGPLSLLQGAVKGLTKIELINFRDGNRIKTGEIRRLDFKMWPYNQDGDLDFHRPYVDEIKFHCPHCPGFMARVDEVIDCWFDAGSMPFAQHHWPLDPDSKSSSKSKKLEPPLLFPADYISEAVDQTRGWFYTLLAIATLLGFKAPYSSVISLGHVLDEKGEKMSKSKGNVVDPWKVVERYGADAVRWYFYTINQAGDEKRFVERDVHEVLQRFVMILWNSYLFFETYVLGQKGGSEVLTALKNNRAKYSKNMLDRWIISRLQELLRDTTGLLDGYDIVKAARNLEIFLIEDLSQWYIRRSRRRFQKPSSRAEFQEASQTLGLVLVTLSRLLAPFMPFLSEEIYQRLHKSGPPKNIKTFSVLDSVHLSRWPETARALINPRLNRRMAQVREIVTLGLKERSRIKIKVRQPLLKLWVNEKLIKGLSSEAREIICDELNVKQVARQAATAVKFDTRITPELKEESVSRELIRQIQEMRKISGLKPHHRIAVYCSTPSPYLRQVFVGRLNNISLETRAFRFQLIEAPKKGITIIRDITIDSQPVWLGIKKR